MAGLTDAIASEVSKVAPILGAVIGSPAAGIGISLLASFFHVKVDDLEGLLNTVQTNPASVQLVESNNKAYMAMLLDKQDARRFGQDSKLFLKILSATVTFGFFAAIFLLYFQPLNINDTEKQLLMLLLGMLASKWQTIIDFYYGASQHKEQ